jgi:hypothetical protein
MLELLDLMRNYKRHKHEKRVHDSTAGSALELGNLSYIDDPDWVAPNPANLTQLAGRPFPLKIASHLVDSYYHLPQRPDMAFAFLWMAINAAFHQLALRESYVAGKTNISDDYGLECTVASITNAGSRVVGVGGTFRDLSGWLEHLVAAVPEKLLSMVATMCVQSIAVELHNCSERYRSQAFNGLKKREPNLIDALRSSYGAAYADLCNPVIDIATRELDYALLDARKAQAVIRSLTFDLRRLIKGETVSMRAHNSSALHYVQLSPSSRMTFFVRNVLYASRNNMAHGKVSSRLNSDTTKKDSYAANVYLYIAGYIVLSVLLVDLRHAAPIVLSQALRNVILLPSWEG